MSTEAVWVEPDSASPNKFMIHIDSRAFGFPDEHSLASWLIGSRGSNVRSLRLAAQEADPSVCKLSVKEPGKSTDLSNTHVVVEGNRVQADAAANAVQTLEIRGPGDRDRDRGKGGGKGGGYYDNSYDQGNSSYGGYGNDDWRSSNENGRNDDWQRGGGNMGRGERGDRSDRGDRGDRDDRGDREADRESRDGPGQPTSDLWLEDLDTFGFKINISPKFFGFKGYAGTIANTVAGWLIGKRGSRQKQMLEAAQRVENSEVHVRIMEGNNPETKSKFTHLKVKGSRKQAEAVMEVIRSFPPPENKEEEDGMGKGKGKGKGKGGDEWGGSAYFSPRQDEYPTQPRPSNFSIYVYPSDFGMDSNEALESMLIGKHGSNHKWLTEAAKGNGYSSNVRLHVKKHEEYNCCSLELTGLPEQKERCEAALKDWMQREKNSHSWADQNHAPSAAGGYGGYDREMQSGSMGRPVPNIPPQGPPQGSQFSQPHQSYGGKRGYQEVAPLETSGQFGAPQAQKPRKNTEICAQTAHLPAELQEKLHRVVEGVHSVLMEYSNKEFKPGQLEAAFYVKYDEPLEITSLLVETGFAQPGQNVNLLSLCQLFPRVFEIIIQGSNASIVPRANPIFPVRAMAPTHRPHGKGNVAF